MKTVALRKQFRLGLETARQLLSVVPAGTLAQVQAELAETSSGRVVLHLLCACRDHRFQWHGRGIAREFARV